MTDKYKYGSISLRKDDLNNIKELSRHLNDGKLSNAQIVKLGILSLSDKVVIDKAQLNQKQGATNVDDTPKTKNTDTK